MRRFAVAVLTALLAAAPASAQSWRSGDFQVDVHGNRLDVSAGGHPIVRNASVRFDLIEPSAARVAENGPQRLVVEMDYPGAADWGPPDSTRTARLEITPVLHGIRIHAEPRWARHFSIRSDDLGDHTFGLIEQLYPENERSLDLRGEVIPFDVEVNGNHYHENYASAVSSFYMSSLGYGSFMDTFARGRYSFAINGRNEIYHDTGDLDWYLFYGPRGDVIHEGYYSVIGRPKHLPMWALGPVIWRDENKGGKDEVLADAAHLTAMRIPFTAMWIDRPYGNGAQQWSEMDFNQQFADPAGWIGTLNDRYGVQLMTWIGPMVFSADSDFPGLFPTYKGYFDLSDSAAVAEFGRRLKANQYAVNVRGHKMDRSEEDFPLYMAWKDRTPVAEQRNKYVYLYSKVTDGFLRDAFGADEFNFARAAVQRTQPYLSAIWGGDVRSTWDGLASNLANGLRAGFMGFPVWGSDTGGYLGQGRIPDELYMRWLEWCPWEGMCEVKLDGNGGRGEDRPPWVYPEPVQRVFRQAMQQRMELLPTLYSLANTSATNGVLMQPLAYRYPSDSTTYGVWDEYLLGDALLVAPVTEPGVTTRGVYLPAGRWIDRAEPSRSWEGGHRVEVDAPIDRIPVLVRANSVYLTGDVFSGNAKNWDTQGRSLVVHVAPGAAGESYTFTYLDSTASDAPKEIRLSSDAAGARVQAPALGLPGDLRVVTQKPPSKVTLGGRTVRVRWDSASHELSVPFAAGSPIDLQLHS